MGRSGPARPHPDCRDGEADVAACGVIASRQSASPSARGGWGRGCFRTSGLARHLARHSHEADGVESGRAVPPPLRFIRALILVLPLVLMFLLLLIPSTAAFAQEGRGSVVSPPANAAWQFRYELFQMLLEERGLTVESSLDAALASPEESVVVMLGKLNRIQVADPGKLLPFVARGGTVLIACDRAGSMGVTANFVSGPITSEDEATQYQNLPDCLRVSDLDRDHPLMSGVNEIVLNRTGWLGFLPGGVMQWQTVASVPQTCSPRRSRGLPLIAVGQSRSPETSITGTMIVAADPSLFTNSMLWHGDNSVLAIRVSELLCRGDKKRLAFVVEGQPQPTYRSSPLLQENASPSPQQQPPPPMPPYPLTPPKPTWDQLLRMANAVIQHIEESNILNEAVINHPRYPNARRYPLVILMGLAVITAVGLLIKLAHTATVQPPAPVPRGMQSAHAMEADEKQESARYGSAAQILARDFCFELTGSRVVADWQQVLAVPSLLSSIELTKKPHRHDLVTVVELAVSRSAPHISPRRLQHLGGIMRRLRTLHREALLPTV